MPTLAEQVAALEAERDAWKDAKRKAEDRAVERLLDMRERLENAECHRLAAESRLASARVEAFVAGWERFAELARVCGLIPRSEPHGMRPHVTTIYGIYPDAEARKKYPASAAPAGEQTPKREPWPSVVGWPYSCDKCGDKGECFTGCWLAECDAVAIRESRPAPTPEPGVTGIGLVLHIDGKPRVVLFTQSDAQQLVALGSRPTQTAEG